MGLPGWLRTLISIHALLAESDLYISDVSGLWHGFLSTLSLRRATSMGRDEKSFRGYFYPRSPCGERLNGCNPDFEGNLISIHALLAESDVNKVPNQGKIDQFLSTLSLRRATLAGPSGPAFLYNFYPRSPCGERHDWPPVRDIIQWISIHALLAESDMGLDGRFKL